MIIHYSVNFIFVCIFIVKLNHKFTDFSDHKILNTKQPNSFTQDGAV